MLVEQQFNILFFISGSLFFALGLKDISDAKHLTFFNPKNTLGKYNLLSLGILSLVGGIVFFFANITKNSIIIGLIPLSLGIYYILLSFQFIAYDANIYRLIIPHMKDGKIKLLAQVQLPDYALLSGILFVLIGSFFMIIGLI